MTLSVPKHVTAIFCDDIRTEMGNKLSYMGVYSSDLVVQSMPKTLPKLCVAVTVVTPADELPNTLRILLLRDSSVLVDTGVIRDELTQASEDIATDPGADSVARNAVSYQFQFVLEHFSIERPCRLRLQVDTDGETMPSPSLNIRCINPAQANTGQ
ncbi:DUF6941 family protein [Sinimarinibacterium sp. CAU 1509]|uniref:DUF6941 family protein n=1 Tax=Sinimarinibacterium sp. CAU 1509 TaxID=2562283 RepID=UPI003F91F60E